MLYSVGMCEEMKILDIWKFHIFALRRRDEIRRSSQLRTLLKRVVVRQLLAQLVERCTGIAEVMGSHSVQAWNFFQVLFTTTRFSSVLSCEDLLISSNYILFNTKIAILKYSRELWFCPLAVYWKSPPPLPSPLPPFPPSPLPFFVWFKHW